MRPTAQELRELEGFVIQQQCLGSNSKMMDLALKVIESYKESIEDNQRMASLNRHYLHHFFGGDIAAMQKQFHYIHKERDL